MRGFQGTPAQTGKEGLFRLVEQAQKSYKDEVTTRQKSYRRYVLDFTHSHRFHDANDAWSKNEHLKNYHTVIELLGKHEILIRKHFDHDLLDENGIIKLLNEFYAIDLSESTTESDNSSPGNPIQTNQNTNIKPLLDRYTLDLIVQLANEVCLFKEVLDADNVAICYAADTLQTVTSRNNSKLVLLLDKLASHDVITYNWQSVIAQKHLVISSSGKKLLTQHDMSSTLNRIKDTTPNAIDKQFLAIIDKYITLIKNKEV